MAWIAIDAGTTVIKAVVFGKDGREIAIAREKTVLLHPKPEYSEQSMESVWQAVVSTVREVAPQCGEPIDGIVTTAQGDGCWLVDAEGKPVRDAVLWNDGRAVEIVEQWRESGALEKAFSVSGSVSYPGLPNAIAAWLTRYEPQSLKSTRWVLTCNGWIFSRMTGRYLSELSDASNPFSDINSERYSHELLRSFGFEELEDKLPPIARGTENSAVLLPRASEEMNLPLGIPVVMAPYDIVTTAYGCGVSLAGQACVILGTTICAEAITASLDLTGTPSGTTIALGGGQFLRAMPTLTGCEAQDWAAKILAQDGLAGLSDLACQSVVSINTPFFLPYMSSAGERAPFLAPDARGSFHHLSFSTTPSQIAQAVYEGLSFVIRECLEAATNQAVQELRVSGGGARSDLWCQMIADVTGIKVIRATGSEHGARGAFLYALAATKQLENVTEGIRRYFDKEHIFTPEREVHGIYLRRYEQWRALRELANGQWALLKGSH
jgi:xylulokinase